MRVVSLCSRRLWFTLFFASSVSIIYLWLVLFSTGHHFLRSPDVRRHSPLRSTPFPALRARSEVRIQHGSGISDLWNHLFGAQPNRKAEDPSRYEVEEAFLRAWNSYKDLAWAHDEVAPVFGGYRDSSGGYGVTLIAALDTLWVMGLRAEFDHAVLEVSRLEFDGILSHMSLRDASAQILGGLIGAYDVSDSEFPILLEKARQLGDVLLDAFDTPNRMPTKHLNVTTDHTSLEELSACGLEFLRLSQLTGDPKYHDAAGMSRAALEQFQIRSPLVGLWPDFLDASKGAKDEDLSDTNCETVLKRANTTENEAYSLSEGSHSFITSLLKQSLLADSSQARSPKTMYRLASSTIKDRLIFSPVAGSNAPSILMTGQMTVHKSSNTVSHTLFEPRFSRSSCSSAATLAISSRVLGTRDLSIAEKIADACIWAHETSRSGIMPDEMVMMQCHDTTTCGSWDVDDLHRWWDELDLRLNDAYNFTQYSQLVDFSYGATNYQPEDLVERRHEPYYPHASLEIHRPEPQLAHEDFVRDRIWREKLPEGAVAILGREYDLQGETLEALFTLYRMTGDEHWREKGAVVFQSINRMTATRYGNARLLDTSKEGDDRRFLDSMRPGWLSGTLKYAYLLFSEPGLVSLDDFVFNAEGHPFKLHQKAKVRRQK